MYDYIILFSAALLVLLLCLFVLYKLRRGWRRVYKAKGPYLLSNGERKFFEALQQVIKPEWYVCPKVRIADMVEMDIPKTDMDYWPMFNKISQKHVDFVICEKATFRPLLIIELDGGSHFETARSLRDILVDNVFKDADIPMLHITSSNFYHYKELLKRIEETIS